MKKIGYMMAFTALAASTACSKIDANTSNNVPTTDAYAASVTAASAAGTTSASPADAVVQTGTSTVPGGMMYGARVITEATFLAEAASSSQMEVQLAQLALDRSAHPEVKTFARMLLDHHTKANKELMDLAAGMNMTLSGTLLPEHQKIVDKLSKLTGREFDKKYMDDLEEVHEQDIALYEVISNKAPTTSIRAFAIRTLPVLRTHEHQADELEDKVEKQ
jgi:putative membrane protein